MNQDLQDKTILKIVSKSQTNQGVRLRLLGNTQAHLADEGVATREALVC